MRKASHRNRLKSHRSVSPLNRTINNSKQNIISKRQLDKRPYGGKQIREETERTKVEDSMKLCLQLASHHQKNALQLKDKNDRLEKKIKEQVKDMQALKNEIQAIKELLTTSHGCQKQVEQLQKTIKTLRSENKELKEGNQHLLSSSQMLEKANIQIKAQNTKLEEQIKQLRLRLDDKSEVQSENMAESVAWSTLSALPVARESRRQQLANNYQCFVKDSETEEESRSLQKMRESYCQELMDMQKELSHCRSMCVRTRQLENALSHKTECLNCLGQYLSKLQENSRGVLRVMTELESQVETVMREKDMSVGTRSTSMKLTSTCTVL